MYCTGGTECLSCTPGTECLSHAPGSYSVCAVRTPLGVYRKVFSIRRVPMLSGFLTLNAQNILPHTGNKGIQMLWGENKGKWKGWQLPGAEPVWRIVGSWWLSGCRGSVAEYWQLKRCPGFDSWWLPPSSLFTSSEFLYFQREVWCSVGGIILQLPLVESTTSCPYMEQGITCYNRNILLLWLDSQVVIA